MLLTLKVLQYIRFHEAFMFVVTMFTEVLNDLTSFVALLFVLVALFSVVL